METKPELRIRFKALRDGCSSLDRAAWSLRICRHLAAFCAGNRIRRLGSFARFGSEVDLEPLGQSDPDLVLLFPRVAAMAPPRLTWGLLEPVSAPHALPPVELLLVPGLAFAADGHRLGYGKGFYDAVLADLPGTVVVLAVGFELQRCQRLPAGLEDRPVQGLVTETGLTTFSQA